MAGIVSEGCEPCQPRAHAEDDEAERKNLATDRASFQNHGIVQPVSNVARCSNLLTERY